MISNIISFIITIALLVFDVFPLIYEFTGNINNHDIFFQTLLFLGIYFLIDYIIGIFISYYFQFSIEERYGFNKTTLKIFIIDKIKGLLLGIIFGGGIIYLLTLAFNYMTPLKFFLNAWIGVVIFVLLMNILYTKIFVKLFNKLTPLADGELKDIIINFSKSVGYEVRKISVMDASKRTTKLNASFSGFGRFKQVILFDNLLEKMSPDEILSVLAHEIGHSQKKHIIKNLLISIINLSVYLLIIAFTSTYNELSVAFGFEGANIGFGIILFLFIMEPISIIENMILNHISRKFEYEADNYAAINTNKESMINALKVLARENYSNLNPHPLYVAIKYSHPPVAYRIRAINNITF
jgi:STE24 endopeptidase